MNKYTIQKDGKTYGMKVDGTPDRRYKAWRTIKPRYVRPIKKKIKYVYPKWYTALKVILLVLLLILNAIVWSAVIAKRNAEYEVIGVHQGEPLNDKNTHCIGEMNKLFCKAWYGWDSETIIKIAQCESRLNPEAYNVNADGSVDRGLVQINSIHGHKPSELYDPELNVYHAYQIWKEQGYSPWYSSENCWRTL